MAYNPSDLRLPPWILYLLDGLIAIRIPIGRRWHIGMTRAGSLMFFSLLGLWAAALYSGNNLLYLCGSMLTAIAIMALFQGIRLLRTLPRIGSFLPDFVEAHSPVIVRHSMSYDRAISGVVHITWKEQDLILQARIHGDESRLMAQLYAKKRCYEKLSTQYLKTSAPLGLWELEYQRQDVANWVVLPQSIAGLCVQGLEQSAKHRLEGDEYHDLRAYVSGDPLARIHWRKSTLEPSTWRIKRFFQAGEQAQEAYLRVDLRLPKHLSDDAAQAAFEKHLGLAWHWLQLQFESTQATKSQLILGQQLFDCSQAEGREAAIQAIAVAMPERYDPKQGAGALLSLVES